MNDNAMNQKQSGIRLMKLLSLLLQLSTTSAFQQPHSNPHQNYQREGRIPRTAGISASSTLLEASRPNSPFDESTIDNLLLPKLFQSSNDLVENIQSASQASSKYLSDYFDLPLTGSETTFLNTLTSVTSGFVALSVGAKAAVVLGALSLVLLVIGINLSNPPEGYRDGYEPYKRGEYDPLIAKSYYSKHPVLVLQRFLFILRISNKFIFDLLVDNYILKREEKNRPLRAEQCLELIKKGGPTAIKVGQALSVRPDLIPREYADSLTTLQDRVPPFDSKKAQAILRKELFKSETSTEPLSIIFSEIDMKSPVASASIGQVYKATMTNGDVVAVKVQRPDALSSIALDLYIVKEYLAPIYKFATRSATDFVGLANEWGRGFISELDYNLERTNQVKFNQEMTKRNMIKVVFAPSVVPQLCTETILTTEWIDGVRLDKAAQQMENPEDVARLCGVALNAYLIMLLEIGTLHCDPHPGNLLRTKDGKLCILDFGMTLETEPNLQYDLLEFVAHLTSKDYDKVPKDLVQLGFLKEERLETVVASGFLKPLTFLLQQASEGGGATKVRERIINEFKEKYPGLDDEELRVAVQQDIKEGMEVARKEASAVSGITMEVEELQKRNKDAFTLPEWFLYTSRAFLTLEGICLQADEDYSLIQSCFPYVAKRLLKDNGERAQVALKDLLYGAGDYVDENRLEDLAEGFSSYTITTKTVKDELNGTTAKKSISNVASTEAAITLAKDSADILLSPEGNLLQNILLEETAKATSAQLKDTVRDILFKPLELSPLGKTLKPFLDKTEEESRAQSLLQKVNKGISGRTQKGVNSEKSENGRAILEGTNSAADLQALLESLDAEQVALVSKELRENLPRYAPMVGQLGGKFVSMLLLRTSQDIERNLGHLEQSKNEGRVNGEELSRSFVRFAAKGVSTAVSRGADVITKQQQQKKD